MTNQNLWHHTGWSHILKVPMREIDMAIHADLYSIPMHFKDNWGITYAHHHPSKSIILPAVLSAAGWFMETHVGHVHGLFT